MDITATSRKVCLFGFVAVALIITGGQWFLRSNSEPQNVFQNRLALSPNTELHLLQTGSLDVEAATSKNDTVTVSKGVIKPLVFPKFILYGDSITEFSFSQKGQWGALLADELRRKCDVLNRGFGGYNSRWNLIMLPRIFTTDDARNIVGVTVFLGANDANPPGSITHVPLDEYRVNIKKITEQLLSVGITKEKIILIGPPPVDNSKFPSRHNDRVTLYSEAVGQVAGESGVHFIELYNSMMKDGNWKRYLVDGLHFSPDGATFLFARLWRVVGNLTKHLPMIQPLPPYVGKHPEVTLLQG